jgi:hypothetical protein
VKRPTRKRRRRAPEGAAAKVGKGLYLAPAGRNAETPPWFVLDADGPDDGRAISLRGALAQLVAMAKLETRHVGGCCGKRDVYCIRVQAGVLERAKSLLNPDWVEDEKRAAEWRHWRAARTDGVR